MHLEPTVLADHRLAAHLHGRRPQRAQQAAEIQHEEGLFAQAELPLREVPALFEDDRTRLPFDLDEDAQLGQQWAGNEQRDLVWRGELCLGLARRRRVLEQAAFDPQREAVDERLDWPVVSQAPDQTVRAGRARDLEAHHVELLAEAVQPRWPGVAGVALQVVLTGERRNRLYGLHLQVAERHRANPDDDESASEHEPSPSRTTSASSSSEIGD